MLSHADNGAHAVTRTSARDTCTPYSADDWCCERSGSGGSRQGRGGRGGPGGARPSLRIILPLRSILIFLSSAEQSCVFAPMHLTLALPLLGHCYFRDVLIVLKADSVPWERFIDCQRSRELLLC